MYNSLLSVFLKCLQSKSQIYYNYYKHNNLRLHKNNFKMVSPTSSPVSPAVLGGKTLLAQ